jgi:acetyl esterase/lipase
MSVSAKLITFFLGLSKAKKLVEKSFFNPPRANKPLVKKHLLKNFYVSDFQMLGKLVVTLKPKVSANNTHVLYFHGGAYLLEGSSMHWKLIETVVNKANCKVSYIDYPLATEYTYKITFDMVQQSFDRLTKENPDDKFIFMGDSADGGLALAFAQKLLNENAAVQLIKNILFSPWLDLSLQNPVILQKEDLDRILPLKGLIEAGKKYAGGDDPTNYLLSPINGEFRGLGNTLVFYGTHELFYPDCKLLAEKVKTIGNFSFYEFPEMQHDWVIFPIPEAKQALNIVIDFI